MSKQSERREAERQARKSAYQALRQQRAQSADILPPISPQSEKCATSFLPTVDAPAPTLDIPPTTTTNPPPTISEAQLHANQTNSKLSTGPATEEGKAIAAQNARTHGLSTSVVRMLATESITDYHALSQSIYAEHTPETDTEQRLADMMITSHWLMERAIRLQQDLMFEPELDTRKMSLFLRYQTTHERSYYRAQRELKASQKERRQNENGFVSQTEKTEALQARTRLENARARTLEVNAACRQVMEIPLPGHTTLSFEELTKACSHAIATLHKQHLEAA